MYKKILAPLDGSEFSECTLEHLKAIAIACKVPEVVLLRMTEPIHEPVYDVGEPIEDWRPKVKERAREVAKNYLSEVADRLKKEGVAANTVVITSGSDTGGVADEILKYTKNNGVDLIIMSTHGRSGITRWAMGSVADRIIRHSMVPVFMVTPSGCRID